MPAGLARLVHAGISTVDPQVRRRQVLANIFAGIAALNASIHLVANSLHDLAGLMPVHVYNAAMVVFLLLNHRLHRYGALTAAIVALLGIGIGHTFVVFALGTASDLQIYFTLGGFILFLVGPENMRVFAMLFAIAVLLLVASFFFAPEMGFLITDDVAFRKSLSFQAQISTVLMNGLLVTFALTALGRAEKALQREHARSEALLTTILPARIAERLKSSKDRRIADQVEMASVLFVDLAGFTPASQSMEAGDVVRYLDGLFSRFDGACARHGADKLKTIGDAYMAVGGLEGEPRAGAVAVGRLALEMMDIIGDMPPLGGVQLAIRAGVHAGPLTAGIIGDMRMSYDVWGETVNIASRMESHGQTGRIQVTGAFRQLAGSDFLFASRGEIEVKGAGLIETWFLTGRGDDEPVVTGQ